MNSKGKNSGILVIDDDPEMRYSLHRVLTKGAYKVITAGSGEEGLKRAEEESPAVIFLDNRMEGLTGIDTLQQLLSRNPNFMVILMTAFGSSQTAIEAMKFGAFDYIVKPFDTERVLRLADSALKAHEGITKMKEQDAAVLDSADYEEGMVGSSERMQAIYKTIGQVAPKNVNVLITGESGTGKELVARCLHRHSLRSGENFLPVNCAAIPENLIESELFGHEKGSFTGATSRKVGKFELCDRGTIFLDEIGDMSAVSQTKILRVLQDGEIQRVGGNEIVRVDVRLIAATNKNLEEMLTKNQFREDLYYRLNVVRIELPALRDRIEDVPQLVDYLLQKAARNGQTKIRRLSEKAISILKSHSWPGNVRELDNVIQHSGVVAQGDMILAKDLPENIRKKDVEEISVASGAKDDGQSSDSEELRGGEETGSESAEVHFAEDRSTVEGREAVASAPPDLGTEDGSLPEIGLQESYNLVYNMLRKFADASILRKLEVEMIRRTLRETGGNQVQAAKILGITRTTLRKRIEQYSIRY